MEDPVLLSELRRTLAARGVLNSVQLQQALARSQPTVSRLLSALAGEVLTLGQGRSTRYALPQPLRGLPARQPLHWIDEAGQARRWGELSHIAGGRLHVQADGVDLLSTGTLPWFLVPLQAEGFLGRALARRLAALGLPDSPERWSLEDALFAALHTPDAPGALVLGEWRAPDLPACDLDTLAATTAATLPAGSSAGGEQAKFLARDNDGSDGHPLLVKFSPPRGTPFGERWHDLLHAEHLALALLSEHDVPVAESKLLHTATRTGLASRRFDRVGRLGRRHAVPLWAAHEAFVHGPRQHWGASCEALERQRRLPPGSAAQARALFQFGRLIGNTDMHFGNLSLFVDAADLPRGRFTLAPLYDMLPMRWRPDPSSGELGLLAFTPDPADLHSAAAPLAIEFWGRLSAQGDVSRGMRQLAASQRRLLGAS